MPGKGTLKGGTMTGGKAGRAAVGWATLWGKAAGSRGTVCTAVTGDGTVETVTTVTGDTATVEVTVATGFRSATTVAAMLTEGEGMLESGLEESVREGVVDGAWVGEAVLAVVFTLLELAAAVTPALGPAGPVPAPAPPTRSGLSSDCWMIFTPSGLLHEDSLVLAL